MRAETIKPVYYELSGAPVTGLSVTATCKDISFQKVLFTGRAVSEDSDVPGLYTIPVETNDGNEYIITFDAGTDSVDNRKQTFVFTSLNPRGGGGGGGHTKTVNGGITKEDVKEVVDEALGKVEVPEGITKEQVEKVVREQIKAIDFPAFPEFPKQKEVDLSPLLAAISNIEGALENIESMKNDEASQTIDGLKENTILVENLRDIIKRDSSLITASLEEMPDTILVELVNFIAALESKKQEVIGNEKVKGAVKDLFKEFKSFKNNK